MPDTFSVSLVIIGLYFCYLYLKTDSSKFLFLYFALSCLGMLCKIPALSLVSVVLILLFIKEIPLRKKITVFIATSSSVSMVFLWYFLWVPHLSKTYPFQLYFPKGLLEGYKEISSLWPQFFKKFYFDGLSSFLAFPFLWGGLFTLIRKCHLYL